MKLTSIAVAFPVLFAAAPALAASQPNLSVALTAPSVHVYEDGTFTVRVQNTGNRNATGVVLTIGLPATHTSPQVYPMGDVANLDGRCARSGLTITCALGQINRSGGYTDVAFDMALPYSTAALNFSFAAYGTNGDSNPSNNTLAFTATPALYAQPITAPHSFQLDHCTGTNLTSFFECALFPSSITGFGADFANNGTLTIPIAPGYGGTWDQNGGPDHLFVSLSDGTSTVGTIDARGVGNGCFEGPMTFIPASSYVALYRICP
ncbi:MAG: hypothetical protein R3B06_21195 [Kofleriaceae bacterium]